MRGSLVRLIVAVVAVASGGCAARTPQPRHTWEVRGSVAALQGTVLEVRDKSVRVVRLAVVDERTLYLGQDGSASRDSLTPGSRVNIDVESQRGEQRAQRVRKFGGETMPLQRRP